MTDHGASTPAGTPVPAPAQLFDLRGRVALVTGAGQGVGAAIACALAARGAAVAVNDLVAERASHVVDQIERSGGRAQAVIADVCDRAAVTDAAQAVASGLGAIDILVNNAGLPLGSAFSFAEFLDTSPEDWERPVRINLFGVLNCVHAVLPGMVERRFGRIVTISSEAGRIGQPGAAAYAAAKAAAVAFSQSLAGEVGKHGITANCVSLGSIANDARPPAPERLTKMLRAYPAGRLGAPADVAAAVTWLVSAEAEWVTGQTVVVNGGFATS